MGWLVELLEEATWLFALEDNSPGSRKKRWSYVALVMAATLLLVFVGLPLLRGFLIMLGWIGR